MEKPTSGIERDADRNAIANQRHVLQIALVHDPLQVIGEHVVAIAGYRLVRATKAPAVIGHHAIAGIPERRHLWLPGARRERPAMNQNHRPAVAATVFDVQAHRVGSAGPVRGRIDRARQGARRGPTQGTGHRAERPAHHHPHGPGHHHTDGGAGGRTSHHAAAHQNGTALAFHLLRFQRKLCCGPWVLGGDAEFRAGLFGQILIHGCGGRRWGGKQAHGVS